MSADRIPIIRVRDLLKIPREHRAKVAAQLVDCLNALESALGNAGALKSKAVGWWRDDGADDLTVQLQCLRALPDEPGYYGLTACAAEHGCDVAEAQKILAKMVSDGAATWWPGREMIAVNRGEQGQLPLGAKE